jgi:4-hydroxy-3-methylbut-2-enyl diphosphate reductase
VRAIAGRCDVVFVVGSVTSSNSNRLRELAEQTGARAYLIDGAEDIDQKVLEGVNQVGVTAGASAPEILVDAVVKKLKALGGSPKGASSPLDEGVSFSLPSELRD